MKSTFVLLILCLVTLLSCDNSSKKDGAQSQKATKSSIPTKQIEKAKAMIAKANSKSIAAFDAEKKYKMLCATCHGFDGKMQINGAKDLTATKMTLEESVARIYFGKSLMTPYNRILKEDEIVAMAKFIEKFKN